MIKNKKIRFILCIFLCWVIWFTIESGRLVYSTDPSLAPLITISSRHVADELVLYQSLGFSQVYYLGEGDEFVSGEFRLFGIPAERWGDGA
ncbi:MAG: hypothetical protein IJE26_01720 [Oscillospiraceae bacterium]|nr:hypothetical protein [Oscillospiraceae bacterium]